MAQQRIYLVRSSNPAFPKRLVKASARSQALTHVAHSEFLVTVATQDDLVKYLGEGCPVENYRDHDQLELPE